MRSLAITMILFAAAPSLAGTVDLRGGGEPLSTSTAVFKADGLAITLAAGGSRTVPWDMVAGVEGVTIGAAEKEWLAVAEDLWRARSRAQRGDFLMARPLFEKHFERFRGGNSESALIVAEGLLRSRLAAGEFEKAIVPAIEVARLRRAGVTTDRYAALVPVLDETTLLCPQLAPAWAPDDRTRLLATEVGAVGGDPAVARLAQLYAMLLRGERAAAGSEGDAGTALLAAIASIDCSSEEARAKARKDLAAATKELPPWAKAWASHALGRALVAQSDAARRMDGTLELLRVAAEHSGDAPLLARRSLELAAATLRGLGDTESAAAIEREVVVLGGQPASKGKTAPPAKPAPAAAPPGKADP